jgi:hypothetical protein
VGFDTPSDSKEEVYEPGEQEPGILIEVLTARAA